MSLVVDKELVAGICNAFDKEMRERFESGQLTWKVGDWTAAILKTFCKIGEGEYGMTCWSSWTGGEYMLDLCWTTYPPRTRKVEDYYPGIIGKAEFPAIMLALESEFGKFRHRDFNRYLVLNDYCKIRDIKSPMKVMIFGYNNQGGISDFDDLVNDMKYLMQHPRYAQCCDHYLLYGISWENEPDWDHQRRFVACKVNGEKVDELRLNPEMSVS